MIPDQSIAAVLSQLAEKLGTTVQDLWPYLVQYTFTVHLVGLIMHLLGAALFVVVVVFGFRVMYAGLHRLNAPDEYHGWFEDERGTGYVICGMCMIVAGAVLFFVTLSDTASDIAGVMVPQAQAVVDIFKLVTAKR